MFNLSFQLKHLITNCLGFPWLAILGKEKKKWLDMLSANKNNETYRDNVQQ